MEVQRERCGGYIFHVQNGDIMIAWQSTKTAKAHGWTPSIGGVLWSEVGIVTTSILAGGIVVARAVTWETLHSKAAVWATTHGQAVEWESLHEESVTWED